MKTTIATLFLTAMSFFSFGQNEELLKVFNDQVDAFNQRDVDRLVTNVSDDFKWYYITPNELILEVEGKDNFKKSMKPIIVLVLR